MLQNAPVANYQALSLSACKSLIEAMGGSIFVDSVEDIGTKLSILLTLRAKTPMSMEKPKNIASDSHEKDHGEGEEVLDQNRLKRKQIFGELVKNQVAQRPQPP